MLATLGGANTIISQSTGFNPVNQAIGGLTNLIDDGLGSVTSWLGGGSHKTDAKAKQRRELTADLKSFTTADERRAFVYQFDSSGRIKTTPEGMAYFYTGEDDYYHKNVGTHHQSFIDALPSWLAQKKREKENSASWGSTAQAGSGAKSGSDAKGLLLIGGGILGITKLMGIW